MTAGGGAGFEAIEQMDVALARAARASGALRAELGAGLEALAQTSDHHELGFASVEAYALERCERGTRWVQESRWLARKLRELPLLWRALRSGSIGFSMAQVIAKVACADDERAWVTEASRRTVRQMRRLTSVPRLAEDTPGMTDEDAACATLTVTVDREDAWLFECTRMVVRHVAGPTLDETVEALIGEGTASLLESVQRDRIVPFDDAPEDVAQREWEAELARWRDEAEARCEPRLAARKAPERTSVEGEQSRVTPRTTNRAAADASAEREESCFDGDATAIDAELRRIAASLARRDVEIGELAEALWAADGWRRLGYATDAQYARERLGMSLSSIKAKRSLARRTGRMPRLALAVEGREVGYEAARLVASVATPGTIEAWVARAGERTVRHLREEVDAATMLCRLEPTLPLEPPSEELVRAIAAIESRIVSGAAFRCDAGAASSEGAAARSDVEHGAASRRGANPRSNVGTDAIAQGDAWRVGPLAGGAVTRDRCAPGVPPSEGQMSAALGALLAEVKRAGASPEATEATKARSPGRVTLRLCVSVGTRRYYRWLERQFHRHRPSRGSFLRFLCCSLVDAWRHSLGSGAAYAEIYARDRHRCSNPVCGRRDVTPHHLRFRSAGGDDSRDNVASLCVWCHLEGVHGGRLQAMPPASSIEWKIGRRPHTVVQGRRRAPLAAGSGAAT